MKNKEFNEDKFFTELFDSKEIHKVWEKSKLYKDYVGSVHHKINVFKDKYYENDEEAKVALQGNRITLKAKQDLNDKSIRASDFQLFNQQGEKLQIDKISIEKNKIEIFPKERILRDSGEKFTINYLGKNSILKEQFSNKSFENTSQAKPLSISDLRLDKEGLLDSQAGFLNLIDLKKDNTIYYTTNPKYLEKLTTKSNELKNFFDLEKQQKQSVISAMDYISKATNINFVYTDDIEKANIGFANSTEIPENAAATCRNFKYADGERLYKIPQTSTEKFTSFEQNSLISLRAPTPEITYEPGSFSYQTILHEVGHVLGLEDVSLNPKLKNLTRTDTLMSYIKDSEKYYTKYNNLDLTAFNLLYGKDGLNHKDGLSYDKTMQTLDSQIQMSKQILKNAANLINKDLISKDLININNSINKVLENKISQLNDFKKSHLETFKEEFNKFKNEKNFDIKIKLLKIFNDDIELEKINKENIDDIYRSTVLKNINDIHQMINSEQKEYEKLFYQSLLDENKLIFAIQLLQDKKNKDKNLIEEFVKTAVKLGIDKNKFDNEIQLVYDKLAEDKNNLPKPNYTFQQKLFEKFNELQKTFDSMIVEKDTPTFSNVFKDKYYENSISTANELKDYSIGELKNISYLKQFKLNEINDLKELNKKINEINKDLQDNTTLQEISNLNRFNKISTDKQILNSQLLNSNNNDKSISQIQEELHQNNKLKELNKKATISQNTPTTF